jgi:sugar phosphate isomerase/epimerase
MKIGVSSYSFLKYMQQTGCDYIKICDLAKELGFEGIEFIDLNGETHEERLRQAKRIKEHCKEIDFPVIAYTVGANMLAEDICSEVKRVKECVDICAELGADLMRHDAAFALKDKPFYTYKDAIAEMTPYIREITEYAKGKGIKTCLENHGFIFQAPERVEELILAVKNENYGWLCDIGNFLCADSDPLYSVAIAAPYTFHAHVKDFLFKEAALGKPEGFIETKSGNFLRGTILGHGIVPVKECIGLLKKAGYDGWVSLEFEGLEDNMTALEMGYRYLKAAIEK